MRKLIVITAALLLCPLAHAAACPTDQKKNEATLVQVEETWARAVERHDLPALQCILAAEFEEAGATGELISRGQMLSAADNSRGAHYELSEVRAHVYGDVAYVRGVGVVSRGGRPSVKTRFTDIFVYRERRWQCVAGHESRFP
jgi:ketosteroid isomerase-like protein